MNIKRVKKLSEIVLDGIKVEGTVCDSTIKSLVLTDANGETLLLGSDYGMNVSVKTPPATETKWKVETEYIGAKIYKEFDYKHEAESFIEKLAFDDCDSEPKPIEFQKVVE